MAPSRAAAVDAWLALAAASGGDGAVAIGGRLLQALLRAEIRLRELVRAVVFQSGPLDVGLGALRLGRRGGDLRLGLGDDRALGVDLPSEAGDRRVLGADASSGRVDRVLIVAVVDRDEQVALVDDLIVDDRNLGQVTHRFGGDDGGVGAHIGVVRRNEETPLDEPVIGGLSAIAERREDQRRNDQSAQAGALGRRGLGAGAPPAAWALGTPGEAGAGEGTPGDAGAAVIAREGVAASGPAKLGLSAMLKNPP